MKGKETDARVLEKAGLSSKLKGAFLKSQRVLTEKVNFDPCFYLSRKCT